MKVVHHIPLRWSVVKQQWKLSIYRETNNGNKSISAIRLGT